MRYLGVRLMQTLSFEIILSVAGSILFFLGILKPIVWVVSLVMLLCIAVNIVRLFFDLRAYYIYSGTDIITYYITNLTVVFILTVLTSVFAWYNIEPLFTWLFFPFKLFNICLRMPKIYSALALNIVFAIITLCVPVFVKAEK